MSNEVRIKEIFEKISNTISSEYNLTIFGEHRSLKGSKREKILRNFLRDLLPQQYSLGDGEIFDSNGLISKQVDIIIHNSHMPVFRYSKYLLLYPIESVFGVCEVKTKLDKQSLKEAIENIQSVKKMKLSKPSAFFGEFKERVYGAVFAYDASDANTIKDNLQDIYTELRVPQEEKIDLICVLNKFIVLGDPKKHGFNAEENFVILDTKKDSLMWFAPIMINGFNKPISQEFNFFKYIKELNIPVI